MPDTADVRTFSIRDNPFKYSCYYSDSESELYYCKARYYSPVAERFTNRDSWSLPNRYAYGNENPVRNSDPSGHNAMDSLCNFFQNNSQYIIWGGVALTATGMAIGFWCSPLGAVLRCKGYKFIKRNFKELKYWYKEKWGRPEEFGLNPSISGSGERFSLFFRPKKNETPVIKPLSVFSIPYEPWKDKDHCTGIKDFYDGRMNTGCLGGVGDSGPLWKW